MSLHAWYFTNRECTVQLPDKLLRRMNNLSKKALPNETGGTLVGRYSDDRRVAYVQMVLGVKRGAIEKIRSFFRPPDSVDGQLAQIYSDSKGYQYYLGEWHSHPYATAKPSYTDLTTLKNLAIDPNVATDTPILIIIGGDINSVPTMTCLLSEKSGECMEGKYIKIHDD